MMPEEETEFSDGFYMSTKVRKYRSAEVQKCGSTETRKYESQKVQECRSTKVHWYRSAGVQEYRMDRLK